jgi:hypothetical protein
MFLSIGTWSADPRSAITHRWVAAVQLCQGRHILRMPTILPPRPLLTTTLGVWATFFSCFSCCEFFQVMT